MPGRPQSLVSKLPISAEHFPIPAYQHGIMDKNIIFKGAKKKNYFENHFENLLKKSTYFLENHTLKPLVWIGLHECANNKLLPEQ